MTTTEPPSPQPPRRASSLLSWLAVVGAGLLLVGAAVLGHATSSDSAGSGAANSPASEAELRDSAAENVPMNIGQLTRGSYGIHGEAPLPGGGNADEIAWQFGTVTSASAGELTVRSEDGTTWTWQLTRDTAVHPGRAGLEKGDEAYVLGARKGGERSAEHVVDAGARGERGKGGDDKPLIEMPDNCEKQEKGGGLTITCGDGPEKERKPAPGEGSRTFA